MLLPDVRSRHVQLVILTVAVTAGVYAKAAIGPIQEAMRGALALSDNQLALLQGFAFTIPTILFGAPLGAAVDRGSRVRLFGLASALLLAGSAVTAVAPDFMVLFVGRCIVGLAVLIMLPAAFSLRTDLYEPHERGRASVFMWVVQFGGVSAAFAVGGALVSVFGSRPEAWRLALAAMTLPLLGAVALLQFGLREPARREQGARNQSLGQSFARLWAIRAVIAPLLVGHMLSLTALAAVMVWAAPAFIRLFGLRADQVGLIMAVAIPVGGVAGAVIGGLISDLCQRRSGPALTMAAAGLAALIAAPSMAFALMPGALSASVALVVGMVALCAISAMTSLIAGNVLPNGVLGLYAGAAGSLQALVAVGLGPLVVSLTSTLLGGEMKVGLAITFVAGLSSLLCALVFALGRRALVVRISEPF